MSLRRIELAILTCIAALFFSRLGSFGLWDPWESHYAEVARQIRVRSDWVSLFWPCTPYERPTGDFWSKPVLLFWLIAASSGALGAGTDARSLSLESTTEWAARFPIAIFALLGVYAVFALTRRFASSRAAILSALACATMPSYLLIARQAMTDMPLVGSMTAAIACLAFAVLDDDRPAPALERGIFGAAFLSFGIFELALSLPRAPAAVIPFAAIFLFAALRLRSISTRSALFVFAAGFFCALAVLAKGIIGVALPGAVLFVFLAITRDLGRIRRLDLVSGAACFVAIACPWYAAMIALHGAPFFEEMFGDNQWRRFAAGVHGDRSGDFTYYLRELGYGLFPWTAVAPAAILSRAVAPARDRFSIFAMSWALVAYLVVTLSATKFHHYILPAIPAIAILCGTYLDEARPKRALLFAGLPALALASYELLSDKDAAARFLWLFDYDYIMGPKGLPWPEGFDYRFAIATIAAIAAIAIFARAKYLFTAVAFGSAIFLADVMIVELAPNWTNKTLLAAYQREKQPHERLVAYRMFWRGESFYSANELYDPALPDEERTFYMRDGDDAKLLAFLARHRGERVFVATTRRDQKRLGRVLAQAEPKWTFRPLEEGHNKLILGIASE